MSAEPYSLYKLKRTPFHERIAPRCLPQNWRRWAGYITVGSYDLGIDREYWAIRDAAALIDVSPLMKYLIEGPDAARLLDRIIPRDMRKLAIGQVFYTGWCDDEGKLLDDGTVTRLGEQSFRLTSAEPSLRWLAMNAVGMQVTITELTDRMAALSLQGPKSRAILNRCCETSLDGLRFFRMAPNRLQGRPVSISRTGYTGDLGYEIWMDAADALPVWDALMAAGADYGIIPCGILAMDMARVEAGPLHARRGLHLRQPRLDRRAEVLALRDGARLDREPRQAGILRRPPGARARAPRGLGVEAGGPRGGLGRTRAGVRRGRPAAADSRHGRARQPADHARRAAGRLRVDQHAGRRCSRSTSRSCTSSVPTTSPAPPRTSRSPSSTSARHAPGTVVALPFYEPEWKKK